jgi:hypothetical protein
VVRVSSKTLIALAPIGERSGALEFVDQRLEVDGIGLPAAAHTAWAHDWQNTSQASSTFLGLSPIAAFIVNGAKPAADLGVITAGAELRLASG